MLYVYRLESVMFLCTVHIFEVLSRKCSDLCTKHVSDMPSESVLFLFKVHVSDVLSGKCCFFTQCTFLIYSSEKCYCA